MHSLEGALVSENGIEAHDTAGEVIAFPAAWLSGCSGIICKLLS